MLALTHHILVQIAYQNAYGKNDYFDMYCILGDDIVIADDLVSEEYLSIMKNLGVGISEYKSIISKDFTEFAKVLKGPKEVDITPLSTNLIVKTLRNNYYLPTFI